jgi:hypothetical protein
MIALYDAMVADMVEEQNARSQFATLQAIIYLWAQVHSELTIHSSPLASNHFFLQLPNHPNSTFHPSCSQSTRYSLHSALWPPALLPGNTPQLPSGQPTAREIAPQEKSMIAALMEYANTFRVLGSIHGGLQMAVRVSPFISQFGTGIVASSFEMRQF